MFYETSGITGLSRFSATGKIPAGIPCPPIFSNPVSGPDHPSLPAANPVTFVDRTLRSGFCLSI